MMASDLQNKDKTLLPQHVTEDELYSNFIPPPVPNHSQNGDFSLPPPTFSTFLPPPVQTHRQNSDICPISSTFIRPPVPTHSQRSDSSPISSTFSPPPAPTHSQRNDISLSAQSASVGQRYKSSSPPSLPSRLFQRQISLPALPYNQILSEDHLYGNLLPPPVPKHSKKGEISFTPPTSTQSSFRIKPCRPAPPPPVPNKASNLCQSDSPTMSSSKIKPQRHAPPPPLPNKSHHPPPVLPKSLQLRRHKTESEISHSYQSQEASTIAPSKKQTKSLTAAGDGVDRLSLSEIIEKHSQSFPLDVQVVKGYLGDHAAVASEEIYSVHSVKQTNVVTLNDFHFHKSYVVPFSSAAKFGLIFQKEGSSCLLPAKFDSVGELMDSTPLPKLVCARSNCCGTNNKSLVRKGEILAIRGIQKGSRALKVASVTDQKEKFLQRECMGHFTTDPFCTQLHLPELVRYVPDPFPVMARMFPDAKTESTFPEHVFSEPVLLVNQYVETSLIATPVSDQGAIQNTVVELPTTLDIEVRVIPPKKRENTQHVYEELDQVRIDSTRSYAQSHLQTSINDTRNRSVGQFGYASSPPATPSSAGSLVMSSLTSTGT